jgi:hypothetical protein
VAPLSFSSITVLTRKKVEIGKEMMNDEQGMSNVEVVVRAFFTSSFIIPFRLRCHYKYPRGARQA